MRVVPGDEGLAAGGGGVIGVPEGFAWDDLQWPDAPHPADDGIAPQVDPTVPAPTEDGPAGPAVLERAVALLGAADRAMVGAVAALRQVRLARGGRRGGMAVSTVASLLSGRTSREVRMLCRAEKVLAAMPHLDTAFAQGRVSWSQVRGIVTAAGPLTAAQTAELDGALAAEVDRFQRGTDEPDRLVKTAFHVAMQLACEHAEQAEADTIETGNHLRMEVHHDGVALAGHVDHEAGATLKAAVEAAADQPTTDKQGQRDADGVPMPTSWLPPTGRSAQLAEGLYRIALAYLCSTGELDPADLPDRAPPPRGMPRWPLAGAARPRVTLVVEQGQLGEEQTGRMLLGLAGGPVPVTRLTIDRALCDAAVGVVITADGRPVAASDHTGAISRRQRDTLHAVDRKCRFPGCRAPAQWTDAHHIIPRQDGGPTHTDNLTLLCRRCHTRVHQHGWQLTMDPTTRKVTVTNGNHTFTSLPP